MLALPGRRPMGVPLGLLFFILYYILFTAGRAGAESGNLPVALGIWLPNILFALFTIVLTRQVANETAPLLLARLSDPILTLLAGLPGRKPGEKRR
jgi:lipopolysaccharide export system permease protein